MPRRRHRWTTALHRLLLMACGLGLAVQPMLASLGELHELSAHAAVAEHATVTVADAAQPSPIPAADGLAESRDPEGHAAADALDVLLHFAHCCGHTPALAVPSLRIAGVALPAAAPPLHALPRLHGGPAMTPFRPPIVA